MSAALDSVERSLGAQYLLSYTPAGVNPKEKSPKLKIEIANPELRAQGLARQPRGSPPGRASAG